MWVWVLLGELGEREGERDRERAVAPSTAPRDGAAKTRALRRGGGGGDGGSGTSSPLRSKTCLPRYPFHPLGAVGASGGVSAAVSAGVGVALASRSGRMGWELPASDSAPKWASVSVLWHSRISFYSKVA